MGFPMRLSLAILFLFAAVCRADGNDVSAKTSDKKARKPNIIFFFADDLGYGELGCYGQKWIKTPNIDAIAKNGIRFTQHYSAQAVCAPCRCSLMTGLHQGHAYIRGNGNPKERRGKGKPRDLYFPGQHPIPDQTLTIAEVLKKQGYKTAAIGKWGLGFEGSSGDPNKQGFDLFYGFLCQVHAHNHYPRFLWKNGKKQLQKGNDRTLNGETFSQDQFTKEALEFIKANRDEPFFLYMPFAIPHLSIQVTDESLKQYKGKIPEEKYQHRGYLKHPFPRAGYAAMISHLDRDIGKIVSLVKQLGLEEDTLIMFSSDNGPTYRRLGGSDSVFFNSAGKFRGYKGDLWEGGIRVPMVASWKGKIKPGSESDLISALWDMFPTFCDVSGAKTPENIDGISLLPTLLGKGEQKKHEYLYWEFPSYGGQQAVRMGKWKGIRRNLFKKPDAPLMLFDLESDIGEQTDIAKDHPEVVKKIRAAMKDSHVNSKLFKFPALDK